MAVQLLWYNQATFNLSSWPHKILIHLGQITAFFFLPFQWRNQHFSPTFSRMKQQLFYLFMDEINIFLPFQGWNQHIFFFYLFMNEINTFFIPFHGWNQHFFFTFSEMKSTFCFPFQGWNQHSAILCIKYIYHMCIYNV